MKYLKNFKMITENPDTCEYKGQKLTYHIDNSYAFGYLYFYKNENNIELLYPLPYINIPFDDLSDQGKKFSEKFKKYLKCVISKNKGTHYNIGEEYSNDIDLERKHFLYPGRIWLNEKIISFWSYPSQYSFKSYIQMLEESLKTQIYEDPQFKVEVVITDDDITYNPKDMVWDTMYDTERKQYIKKFVALKDYAGSEKEDLDKYKPKNLGINFRNYRESLVTDFSIFENRKTTMENYDKYLKKLTDNYGDAKESKEVLDWYISVLDEINENGGEIYRIVYVENKKEINQDDLGFSWTLHKDAISRFIGNIEVEEEGVKPFLITAEIKPGKVDYANSFAAFCEIPDEEEINFHGDPIVKDIRRWKKN